MAVTVLGQADPDTRTQLEVFAGSTRVFNDAQLRTSRGQVPVNADVSSSQTLVVRLTCESTALALVLHNPTLTR
jgi:hypothetical protein